MKKMTVKIITLAAILGTLNLAATFEEKHAFYEQEQEGKKATERIEKIKKTVDDKIRHLEKRIESELEKKIESEHDLEEVDSLTLCLDGFKAAQSCLQNKRRTKEEILECRGPICTLANDEFKEIHPEGRIKIFIEDNRPPRDWIDGIYGLLFSRDREDWIDLDGLYAIMDRLDRDDEEINSRMRRAYFVMENLLF